MKEKSIGRAFGDWDKSYELLPKWLKAFTDSNSGSRVIWKTIPTTMPSCVIFERVFWAFGPSIEVFQHCRPVISIDGTFLYGKYKGTLLIASTWDGGNRLFPLSFAIVEKETDDSWYWFLRCIQINVTNQEGLYVISNRHPGIMTAIQTICQSTRWYHHFCLRHVASNFNQ